jgi:UDP-N-acetylglucosamine transferase subunit ALG13
MSLNLFFDIPNEEPDEDLNDYLLHCYLYYKLNNPIIYDYDFDNLCNTLVEKWDSINHSYKKLVSLEDLKAGTGYSITDYPKEIIEEAERRKAIFIQELQHEVEVAKEFEAVDKPMTFSCSPTETYLLCGMYIDYGFHKDPRKEKVNLELRKRMVEDIHRSMIEQYTKDHNVTLEKLNLS